ncbi:phosphotransferase family protein [Pantanalinema sp. GBBB05]|uniref:phosphotransferase family protein n=1 Tax=Pantanalinema sp. GBBB05 TaxID=2604139 RepID=UPI001DABABBB|nr:phosphotransferase [Pantanalinema sp. GBBB05]
MTFWLNSQNVFDYLNTHGLYSEPKQSQIEQTIAKNFNLIISLSNGQKLLIKQERYSPGGRSSDEFCNEWRIQEFLQQFPELNYFHAFLPEVIHFDPENSIIVARYLTNYRDLTEFYRTENQFPASLASAIAQVLAEIHRTTFERRDYQEFFTQQPQGIPTGHPLTVIRRLERITPEVFGAVPTDGLKFFALYQRYESLQSTIAQLLDDYAPCCLTHNDLKLNNILLHHDWEQMLLGVDASAPSAMRLIDWERCAWGDPAFDLGMLIGSYLSLWLNSLVVSKTIAIEESLRMAVTPLEQLQPSMAALMTTYLQRFPEIVERCPNFLVRSVQFAGVALILQIQATLQHAKLFGNTGICSLQVAKGLLCRPEQSIATVFGATTFARTELQPA